MTSCSSASSSVRNSRVETGRFAALRWRKKSTSTAPRSRRLPWPLELVAEVLLHRWPFAVDDAEDHGVAFRAVGAQLMIAQYAVLLRTQARDRRARRMIEPVRAKFDCDALQLFESVGKKQKLALGVDGAALNTLGVPRMPDLEPAVDSVDVEVARAANDLARRLLAAHDRP